MGYESDQGEGENPNRQDEEEEIPFEGQEYNSDTDIELANDDYSTLAQEPLLQVFMPLTKAAMKRHASPKSHSWPQPVKAKAIKKSQMN